MDGLSILDYLRYVVIQAEPGKNENGDGSAKPGGLISIAFFMPDSESPLLRLSYSQPIKENIRGFRTNVEYVQDTALQDLANMSLLNPRDSWSYPTRNDIAVINHPDSPVQDDYANAVGAFSGDEARELLQALQGK